MSTVVIVNLAVEISCSILCCIFIASIIMAGGLKDKLNRAFILVLVSNIAVMLSDATAFYSIGKTAPHNFVFNYLGNVGTYIFSYCLIMAFSRYLYLYFSTKRETSKTPVYLIYGLQIFAILCTILALFNHMYFTIDAANIYHRQGMYWFSQILGLIGMVINSVTIIQNTKYMNRVEKYAFATYIILPVIGIIIQTAVYGFVSVYIASTWTIIVIYISVQSQQARLMREQEFELMELERQKEKLDESNDFLDQINTAKTQMLTTISHEMGTPLSAISANAQLVKVLIERQEDRREISQNLDFISEEAGRLARLARGMLELGTFQESQRDFRKVDIAELLVKSGEGYQAMLDMGGNRLELAIPQDLPFVKGNPDMLVQVVLNLLSNSAKNTRNGLITITAESKADFVVTQVKDNGKGISPALVDHVFERGIKGETNGNIGIGLTVCRDIVQQHGGTISLISTEGVGTTVTFSIPLAREE